MVPVVHAQLQPEIHTHAVRLIHGDAHWIVSLGPEATEVLGAAPEFGRSEHGSRIQPVDDELHAVHFGGVAEGVTGVEANSADKCVHWCARETAKHDVRKSGRSDRRVDGPGCAA